MADRRPAEEGPASKRPKTSGGGSGEEYKCSAAEAVRFHLVEASSKPELTAEIDSGGASDFACEYYHQVFGEEEEILGYKDLAVDIWLSASTYQAWVDVRYSSKRKNADDVEGSLREAFPAGFATSRSDFEAAVSSTPLPQFASAGRNVAKAQMQDGSTLLLQHFKLSEAPAEIKAVHKRIEPMVLFMIDGGTAIDADDERWELVLAVLHDDAGARPDLVAGFATIYNFYAWPVRTRPRLAQVLVLPPYQCMGIGKALLQAAYRLAQDRDATDLTFEDPSPNLQRLREKVDLEMMMGAPWLVELARQQITAVASGSSTNGAQDQPGMDTNGHAGNGAPQPMPSRQRGKPRSPLALPQEAASRLASELKIHPKQARSTWEALLLLQPGMEVGSSAMSALEALVKARLEAEQLSSLDAEAASKRIVQVEGGKEDDFFMWRSDKARASTAAPQPGASAAPPAIGSEEAGSAAVEGEGTVNVGRHTVTQMSAEERAAKLQELLEERMAQLGQLQSLLSSSSGAGGAR